ncbi:MAG: c-type cytochrome domain-containing protein, partial [Akkermansiaceae bacterium]
MSRLLPALFAVLLLAPSAPAQEVQFNRDIRPILSNKCFFCHGPDEKKRKAGLRLDLREGALADLGDYAAIVPGKPEESEILSRVAHRDPDEVMPPPKSKRSRLTASEGALPR